MNLSLSSLQIPSIWKSYRPINLLSRVAKLLELLLPPYLQDHLKPTAHQNGFRKNHSTTNALQSIKNHIQSELNQERPRKRTVIVALDLTAAFHTICHTVLLRDILNSTQHTPAPTQHQALDSKLHYRQTDLRCVPRREVKFPQDEAMCPKSITSFFNLYVSSLPVPDSQLKLMTYADGLTVVTSENKVQSVCSTLSVKMSTSTLFTS